MKIKDLRELTIEELTNKRREIKHEMLHLRVQQVSGQLENPARLYLLRKDVARIETLLTERAKAAPAKPAAAKKPVATKPTAPTKAPAKKTKKAA